MNIQIASGEMGMVNGVTGTAQPYYKHRVTINIGGWDREIEAGFMPDFPSTQYGIVGQVGFFDFTTIKFDYSKEVVEIKLKG